MYACMVWFSSIGVDGRISTSINIDLKDTGWEVVYWIHVDKAGDQLDSCNMITNRGFPGRWAIC
jgi:hypothetical protein